MIKYISLILSSFAFGSSIVSYISFQRFYLKYKKAIEKSKRKEVHVNPFGFPFCPYCSHQLYDFVPDDYCSYCGQALDWSNYNE